MLVDTTGSRARGMQGRFQSVNSFAASKGMICRAHAPGTEVQLTERQQFGMTDLVVVQEGLALHELVELHQGAVEQVADRGVVGQHEAAHAMGGAGIGRLLGQSYLKGNKAQDCTALLCLHKGVGHAHSG